VLFLDAEFYRCLSDHPSKDIGLASKYTNSRGINIFNKKMIVIPVNGQRHWSLAVLINCGHTVEAKSFSEFPMLLFLDSLPGIHKMKEVKDNLLRWLNGEFDRLYPQKKPDPFTTANVHAFKPKGT